MTFGPFPAALQNAIQQNFLEREFMEPLLNILAYRNIADKEIFSGRIGDTITKTRTGLMVPNTTPLNPSSNTNIDNGLTPQQYSDEQFTLAIAQYPQVAPQINLIDDETTIASFALENSMKLGIAQATAVDRIVRQILFNAYMGGNTVVTATLGAPATTIAVDDVRGFQTAVQNGNVLPISGSNTLPVFINGVLYQISGFTVDGLNVSSAWSTGGISGTITATVNISVLNGTAGNAVIGSFAPFIARPNGRQTTAAIQSTDLLNMTTLLNGVTYLRNNAVPKVRTAAGSAYNFYLNSTSMNELFQDPEFQILNRGVTVRDPVYEDAWINSMFLDIRFVMTTETYVQNPSLVSPPPGGAAPIPVAQTIQRPILCGKGAVIEGVFSKGLDAIKNMTEKDGIGRIVDFKSIVNVMGQRFGYENFYQYLRPPIDSLAQIITQTSNYIGGFTVPTDVTTTQAIIPTASNAYFKRAVIFETA